MYNLVMVDTDGLKFTKKDGSAVSESDVNSLADKINKILPDGIVIENDGIFDKVLIVKTKNYAVKTEDKVKIKGSALKATMKETALKGFLSDAIDTLLLGNIDGVHASYGNLVREIGDLKDIGPWSSKKTVTRAVLEPKRTNESRVLDALQGENYQEGDKVRMFFKSATELCLDKNFTGVYDKDKLYEKLFKTVKVLAPVLDMEAFPNYKLKKNKVALEEL